ncbi:hypothetical protein C0J52_24631 [Blattella germanica]|nr:hypothetical protein C0J52_24631 [Blattella germanica]
MKYIDYEKGDHKTPEYEKCAVFETGKYGESSKLEKLKGSFKVLDNYLDGSAWASGNELSVADYTIAATVASCEVRCF